MASSSDSDSDSDNEPGDSASLPVPKIPARAIQTRQRGSGVQVQNETQNTYAFLTKRNCSLIGSIGTVVPFLLECYMRARWLCLFPTKMYFLDFGQLLTLSLLCDTAVGKR